jgi:energy-coupling factor transporter ATP-binding protein EcfA2
MSNAFLIEPEDTPFAITLPNGDTLTGRSPVVVVGPNGSGKTRRMREVTFGGQHEFINALRNTMVASHLQPMNLAGARSNLNDQRIQARNSHWTLSNEFETLLAKLYAEDAESAVRFREQTKAEGAASEPPTTMERVQELWRNVFPDRELAMADGAPKVTSRVGDGEPVEYSGQFMSDGEKAGLYLAARVLDAASGVVVVDEPETHFHSLLASRFWDYLEEARPDIRFVYITHDLPFALSRSDATFVLANPKDGLTRMQMESGLPAAVAEAALGAASFSFYATRIILCEGDEAGLDAKFYRAWFKDRETTVEPVGSCEMVFQCATTLQTHLATGLEVAGIIDRDFRADPFLTALPDGVSPLRVHEIESLLCVPEVVELVAKYTVTTNARDRYLDALDAAVNDAQRHKVIVERWKTRVESLLVAIPAAVKARHDDLQSMVTAATEAFRQDSWSFDPVGLLNEEITRVSALKATDDIDQFLSVIPGKGLLSVATAHAGARDPKQYFELVVTALKSGGPEWTTLGSSLRDALSPYVPLSALRGSRRFKPEPRPG